MGGLPKRQLAILSACRFSEPIAYTSVNPYLYNMIKGLNITDDEKKIGTYGGLVASVFSLGSFLTGVAWGRLSDRIGRKPVVLTGLIGTVFSSLLFGTSLTIYQAVIARFAMGLLNGNVGIIRTMVAELVTDKRYQATAFSIMPIVWSCGSIIGPALGGTTADPVHSIPWLFSNSALFKRFPYLLPNVIVATLLAISAVVGWFLIEETLSTKKDSPDLGRRCADSIGNLCRGRSRRQHPGHDRRTSVLSDMSDAERGLLDSRPSTGASAAAIATLQEPRVKDVEAKAPTPPALREMFTSQVTLNIAAYASLSLHTVTFDQIYPIFLATELKDGGLGLEPADIGTCLSIVGIFTMIFQILVYPPVQRRIGSAACMRIFSMTNAATYLLTPLLQQIAHRDRLFVLFCASGVLMLKFASGIFMFPSSAILVTNSVPTKRLLGTVNGMNQAMGSLARMIGPATFGFLLTYSLETNFIWLVWMCLSASSILTGFISCFLLEDASEGKKDASAAAGEDEEIDTLLHVDDVDAQIDMHDRQARPQDEFDLPDEDDDSDDESAPPKYRPVSSASDMPSPRLTRTPQSAGSAMAKASGTGRRLTFGTGERAPAH